MEKLIIIGSGPAGLTAAIYAARADLKPLLFAGVEPGGQLMWTTEVENFPGFPEGIQGPELMNKMMKQAERFGTRIQNEKVTKADFSGKPLKLWVGEKEYAAKAVIIATGAEAKWLNLPSETKLRGKGVSACATCDGFFFKGKDVVVVGGGDTALEEATFLTKFANKVTVLVRGEALSGSKAMQNRAVADEKITLMYNTSVVEVLGENAMEGLKIKNATTGEESEIKAQGLFVAIGHAPASEVFAEEIELGKMGYIQVKDHSLTNIEGVFVSGDVHDYKYRQAITAAGMGCMAALDAQRYLEEKEAGE
ncbi:MAG: thioredoxin-disulfide reductase [Patescibacteria group bacterium]|jgi:thioredoxin reductase (NADPH)